MSLTGVARRTGPPSCNRSATRRFPDITIGPDILELLSSAMYVDPMTIYREYVQNAADAVDAARHSGISGVRSAWPGGHRHGCAGQVDSYQGQGMRSSL